MLTNLFKSSLILLIAVSCNLPTRKPLNVNSKQALSEIENELGCDPIEYGYRSSYKNGKSTTYFTYLIIHTQKGIDLKPYNERIMESFSLSGYDFKEVDYIVFHYYGEHTPSDFIKYFKYNNDLNLVEEKDE